MTIIMEAVNLSKRFGGLNAVSEVSFTVNEGTIFGIIGANGAGKTTLFNMLSGAAKPTAGHVKFAGTDITALSPSRRCALGIGRTFQIARPFPGLTVLETVRISALNRTNDMAVATRRAEEILERMDLIKKASTQGHDLTVVERKRLELARAYATGPRVLLLDEVAAGLRPPEVQDLVRLVKSVAKEGVTVLIIEHVLDAMFSLAESIMVVDHGKKIAEGTPSEIVNHKSVIEAYLGAGYAIT